MMKALTEIVFILDRSGSMSGLERDTIGGAIHHIGNVHKYSREEDRPEKTIPSFFVFPGTPSATMLIATMQLPDLPA